MAIERNVDGIVDYCIDKVEELDERDDLDIEKKVRYGLAYLKEARGYVGMNLAHKKLTMQAPEIAKNPAIVLPLGSTKPRGVEAEKTPAAEEKAPESEAEKVETA